MKLVRQGQHCSSISSTWEPDSAPFQPFFYIVHHVPIGIILVFDQQRGHSQFCKRWLFRRRATQTVAVDLRRVVQLAGRLTQEKVRKECLCVVSGSARCTTLRDKEEVWLFLGERRQCASWLEPCRCIGSMCDCTLWQQDCNKTELCMTKSGAR